MNEQAANTTNRRKALQILGGTAVAATGFSPLVTATSSSEMDRETVKSLIKEARKIGNVKGLAQREEFLENSGIPTGTKKSTYSLEEGDSESVSTNEVRCVEPTSCDGDIDVALSISYLDYSDEFFVDSATRIRYNGYRNQYAYLIIEDGGEAPVDGLGIQWEQNHWRVADPDDIPSSTDTGTHSEWDNGSWNQEGLAFRIDDYAMCEEGGANDGFGWSPYEYSGVYLIKDSGYQAGDSITAAYSHVSQGSNISFGVSYPAGIMVSSSSTSKAENLQTDLNGNTLRVTESDAHPIN